MLKTLPALATVRKHVVITGTGRAGTSFLVQLLTRLGLDTGFSPDVLEGRLNRIAHAGLEHDIRADDVPYVVKSPWFCDYADEVIKRDDIAIEHVFVPFRDLQAAAESRRDVQRRAAAHVPLIKRVRRLWRRVRGKGKVRIYAGGLWGTKRGGEQEHILRDMVYKLFHALSDTHTPVTLLRYPRLAQDSRYLYRKIKPILPGIGYEEFRHNFEATVRPELIHRFSERDR